MTEKDDIINFIEQMDPKEFVQIHQDNFKEYYLSKPPIEIDNELFDDWCLWDTFQEKYREFFVEKGLDETYKWLNPSLYSDYSPCLKNEDISLNCIKYHFFDNSIELSDDDLESSSYFFDDLYFDMWSSWAISWFIYEIVNLYQESKINEEVLEFN
jgi:hypothetical protein